MPEYLAPGVYVEETTYRQKSIEGVSTSTAGFVGPTRFGPTTGQPELLTSFLDFERIYGGIDPLSFGDTTQHNDLAHAVRGFFENGGRRLYVARTFQHPPIPDTGSGALEERFPDAGLFILDDTLSSPGVALRARWPGAAGNFVVTFDVRVGPNILTGTPGGSALSGVLRWDTVLVGNFDASLPVAATLHVVDREFDNALQQERIVLRHGDAEENLPEILASGAKEIRVVTVTVTVGRRGRFMDDQVWENLNPDPRHQSSSLARIFAPPPTDRATALNVPLIIELGELTDGASLVEAMLESLLVTSLPSASTAAELIEHALVVPRRREDPPPTPPVSASGSPAVLMVPDPAPWPTPATYRALGRSRGCWPLRTLRTSASSPPPAPAAADGTSPRRATRSPNC
ncbi:hypothetical protein ACFQZK_00600 [Rhodococcus aetherivorans]